MPWCGWGDRIFIESMVKTSIKNNDIKLCTEPWNFESRTIEIDDLRHCGSQSLRTFLCFFFFFLSQTRMNLVCSSAVCSRIVSKFWFWVFQATFITTRKWIGLVPLPLIQSYILTYIHFGATICLALRPLAIFRSAINAIFRRIGLTNIYTAK